MLQQRESKRKKLKTRNISQTINMGIKQRIYNDFFRPSKEQDYEKILRAASENGYNSLTLREFAGVVGGAKCRIKCW